MTKDESEESRQARLRKVVEERIKHEGADISSLSGKDVLEMVHDLHTHQIELEMQNEELRHAHEQLEQSLTRYSDLYDFAPVGYVTTSPKGLIIEANLTLATMLGDDRNSLLQRRFDEFLAPADCDNYYRHRQELLETKQQQVCELQMINANGDTFWVQISSNPIESDNDNTACLRTAIVDISERKASEAMESELQDKLVRARYMESLGIMAGGIAHDLNNTLGPLVVLPDCVREDIEELAAPGEITNRALESLDVIKSSALRSASVVRNLVLMSRQGHTTLKCIDINTLEYIRLDSSCGKRIIDDSPNIKFVNNLSHDKLLIMGDKLQLERAIRNMIRNSVEAIKDEGEILVSTSLSHLKEDHQGYEDIPAGEYATITIHDSGEGIQQDNINHIFEPFFTKKKQDLHTGSGLGLSVVHGVIKDHGGFLDLSTELHKGTTISLHFPITEEPEETPAGEKAGPIEHGTEMVLIVDDEPAQRFIARRNLEKLGYKSIEVCGGEEAIELFTNSKAAGEPSPCDLILMDMIMGPGFNGLHTSEEILKIYPKQKIIISSGYSEDAHREASKSLGIVWLAKPYDREKLAETLRECLDRE